MGDRMRITARVTDTETGAVAASAKADGDVSEIFSLQDRIADDLGNLLLVRITGGGNAATSASRAALPADRGNDNRNTTATGNGNGNGEAALPGRPARSAPLPPAEVTGGLELGAATASEDDFSVNGYNVQGDSIINARGGGGWRSRWWWRRRRRRSRFWTLGDSVRRRLVGCVVRQRRTDRGRRLHGRDGDTVQESALSAAGPRSTAPLGVPDRPRDPRQGRERRLAPISRGVSGFRPQMGLLEGMTNLPMSRNLEIMPVATGIQLGSRVGPGLR